MRFLVSYHIFCLYSLAVPASKVVSGLMLGWAVSQWAVVQMSSGMTYFPLQVQNSFGAVATSASTWSSAEIADKTG
jgi:hypothetical protein